MNAKKSSDTNQLPTRDEVTQALQTHNNDLDATVGVFAVAVRPFVRVMGELILDNIGLQRRTAGNLSLKVSIGGAISVYGLGRFPVTLYKQQMDKFIGMVPEIERFMAEHASELSTGKDDARFAGVKEKRKADEKAKAVQASQANRSNGEPSAPGGNREQGVKATDQTMGGRFS